MTGPEAKTRPAPGGYTLIEVLVVILVTSVLVGLVVPRLGRAPATDPAYQLDRLAALLDEWCNRAVIQGRALGVQFESDGYAFSLPTDTGNAWLPASREGPFRARRWDPALKARLLIDGRPVPLGGNGPQVTCHATGELTPFELRLSTERHTGRLRANFDANLRVTAE